MKERHPIDDLFRKGLYDSEATPPADVWQRVVARRSWGHRLLVGLQRRWAVGLVGAALVLTPLAWYAASSGNAVELAQTGYNTGAADVSGSQVEANASNEGPGQVVSATRSMHETTGAGVQTATVPTTSDAPERLSANAAEKLVVNKSSHERGAADGGTTHKEGGRSGVGPGRELSVATSAATHGALHDEHARGDDGPSHSSTAKERVPGSGVRPVPDGQQPLSEEHVDYVTDDMPMLRTRLTDMDRALHSLKTVSKPIEVPYVLPHGAWWFGVQFGWNEWNGGWRGDGRLAEEMNASETWENGWQAGVVGGRTWRSGLSVSAGLEYAQLKSRFLFTEEGVNMADSGMTMMLDTTWSVNAVAPDSSYIVYTYDIAYVPVEGYTADVRYNATNRYALLSLPVEVAYQWNMGRFTLAPRAGAAFNWFVGRNGRALVSSTNDGSARAVPLSDTGVDDRFGMWVTGTVGADVGYALDERTQVFAGGGYTGLLMGGGELQPSLSGAQLRVRLVREFGMKQRKAKLP